MTAAEARAIQAKPIDPKDVEQSLKSIHGRIADAASEGREHIKIISDTLDNMGLTSPKAIDAVTAALTADGYEVKYEASAEQCLKSYAHGVRVGRGPMLTISW